MVYFKLLLTAIFWGGTFIAGKSIAGNVSPINAAFIRFAMASFFLLLITKKTQGKLPAIRRKDFIPLLLLGSTGVFSYNILFFNALHHIPAGKASLIIATNPIMISLLSALIFKESVNLIKCTGILLSVTGALVVISDGNLINLAGDAIGRGEIMIMGCVASWVTYSLIGKKIMGDMSPIVSVCYSSVAGTFLLMFPVVLYGDLTEIVSYTPMNWFSLFYLAFFGTVLGFLWYYEGIKTAGAMKASVFINFVPVSAIILSWLMLDETISIAQAAGTVLVISGVYSTNASTMLQKRLIQSRAKAPEPLPEKA
ncbi:conserved membrane hypothetical protein [Desulfamplus magnetovallimortis]|uniref:EamA domain-containing protein n=1 Tax=Desulfamplus magnetovallimortis TaxID=1246637 RepID=A0A1W1HGZ5_9BACT|nr:DMT family transporter [Desulfamplus magnetovallimortis]SLM31652.1 conserved membrane hypothetical protein [Desulfamplus magnetovallimortis]